MHGLNCRIDATVKAIDNTALSKSNYKIFREESNSSDLTIFGIPPIDENNAGEYIQSINSLLNDVGTTLLVNTSSYFKEIKSAEEE